VFPLIVVDNPKTWPLHIPGASVIAARAYLTDPVYSELRNARVFNLCRSYRYQSTGYYVSLLAMARGHKPLPNITTIQDMKSGTIIRLASDDLEDVLQASLKPIHSHAFTLSIYFGRNLAKRYDALSAHLFRLFQAPFLQAEFVHDEEDGWRLRNISPLAANEIPEAHKEFAIEAARQFFAQKRYPAQRKSDVLFDLAILVNPDNPKPPSNRRALKRLVDAAKRAHFSVELIDNDDFGRIGEFDALFIRETTAVNHFTYRFARRAVAEGLVVIDDPDSITKCTNKVYLAELLDQHSIPRPKTLIIHKDNREAIRPYIGLPCVLKQPDSSFSMGVTKVDTEEELNDTVDRLLADSDLIIAQQFIPTPFDWRITVLDRQLLFACKYHMAPHHWQIIKPGKNGDYDAGEVEPVPPEQVPPQVLSTAMRATKLIGDGLYGVDLKQIGNQVYLIEINDNPNIDAGYEDRLMGDDLYDRVMQVFLRRIQQRKNMNDRA
jgi:glutathione synthase/RimK-type ligase-like ATP-grasp enzyme